jgi:predicted kinase
MKQPKLYMLIGVPGSGKSSWVRNQYWAGDCTIVSTDYFVEKYAHETSKTYMEVFDEYMPIAVQLMARQVETARENRRDIIWDQTSTTVATRKKKFNMLPDYYAIAVVFRTPQREDLDNRLRSRSRNGKVIPDDVIEKMIAGFEMPTIEEGFKEIWYAS